MEFTQIWTVRKLSLRRSISGVRVRVTRPNFDEIGRLNLAQLKLILIPTALAGGWNISHSRQLNQALNMMGHPAVGGPAFILASPRNSQITCLNRSNRLQKGDDGDAACGATSLP